MRLHKLFFLTLSLVAAFMVLFNLSLANHVNGTAVKFIIGDDTPKADTMYFGFTNSPTTTYCIDKTDTVHLAQYGVDVTETELPPSFNNVFDARFTVTRSGGCTPETEIGNGMMYNFHQGGTVSFKDTFKIQFQPNEGATMFLLYWTLFDTSRVHITSLTMKLSDGTVVDMKTSNVDTLNDVDINKATFYFQGTFTPEEVKQTNNAVPTTFTLSQCYPNPFNPTTNFNFSIVKASNTTITIYDILGRAVTTLLSQNLAPGYYTATWNGLTKDGMAAASGMYFIRMSAQYQNRNGESDQFVSVQKVLLMK